MRLSKVHSVFGALAVFASIAASASVAGAAPVAQATPPRVTAADQPIVNNTVVCAEIVADVDGWIAVHGFQVDGKLIVNQVVGTTPIKAGVNKDVAVTLNEQFKPGDALVFMLHVDEGPTGSFDFPGGPDKAVVVNNQVVLTQFKVLGDSPPATMPNTGDLSRQMALIGLVALFVLLNGLALRRRSRSAVPVTHD